MLDNTGTRQLCYVCRIDDIKPIIGRDRVESAVIGGWTVMVRKDQFKPGDLGIYFEIDSKVPAEPPFEFLAAKHYKIKTQKYALKDENGNKVGQYWSQGLLMSAEDFGWELTNTGQFAGGVDVIDTKVEGNDRYLVEGDFLTSRLKVTYSVEEDNKRKSNNPDAQINAALARHPKIAKKFGKYIKKNKILRKLFLMTLGRKSKRASWPEWVQKTDEERVQNMTWILENKNPWFATEKIDGTSTTFTLKRGKHSWNKNDYRVCSRNVCFDKPDKKCYYDETAGNVYLEMSEKYHMEDILTTLLNSDSNLDFVTIQGETYGASVQKRDYSMKDHDLAVFNLIYGYKDGTKRRCNPREMTDTLTVFHLPCVPIVDEAFILPNTVEELLNIATGKSAIDGGMREGLVFRAADGTQSFKAVSNEFLMRYHNG